MNRYINNVPISEFAAVIGGYAFKSEDFIEEGIPVIKIKNFGSKKLSFEETDYLPRSFLGIPDKFKIKFGDVLISMTGSQITQPNSAVGRVARSYLREISLLNQRVGKMQINPKKCDLGFLYHYMSFDVFRDQIGLRSRGAANQANVTLKAFLFQISLWKHNKKSLPSCPPMMT
jgi:type I restriction enzyme, S subunit